jgi:phosphoglycolate phosphatase
MVNNKPQAVLFDLDGTLLDTAPDFHRIINRMRAERQLPQLSYEAVREQVSNGAAALIRHCFDCNDQQPEFEPLRLQLLDLYLQSPAQDSKLFDGMDELLDWLQQQRIHWGVVTNKPARFSQPILAALGLEQACSTLICPDHIEQRKPHPEGLLLACRQLNCQPQQCLYVGDHRRDIEAARNAGMTSVAVSYGYLEPGDPIHDWGAELLFDHPEQLLDWLKRNF